MTVAAPRLLIGESRGRGGEGHWGGAEGDEAGVGGGIGDGHVALGAVGGVGPGGDPGGEAFEVTVHRGDGRHHAGGAHGGVSVERTLGCGQGAGEVNEVAGFSAGDGDAAADHVAFRRGRERGGGREHAFGIAERGAGGREGVEGRGVVFVGDPGEEAIEGGEGLTEGRLLMGGDMGVADIAKEEAFFGDVFGGVFVGEGDDLRGIVEAAGLDEERDDVAKGALACVGGSSAELGEGGGEAAVEGGAGEDGDLQFGGVAAGLASGALVVSGVGGAGVAAEGEAQGQAEAGVGDAGGIAFAGDELASGGVVAVQDEGLGNVAKEFGAAVLNGDEEGEGEGVLGIAIVGEVVGGGPGVTGAGWNVGHQLDDESRAAGVVRHGVKEAIVEGGEGEIGRGQEVEGGFGGGFVEADAGVVEEAGDAWHEFVGSE